MSNKMKTNKSALKRFRRTKSGKIKRMKSNATHLFTGKTTKRKRQLRHATLVSSVEQKRIAKLIPYA